MKRMHFRLTPQPGATNRQPARASNIGPSAIALAGLLALAACGGSNSVKGEATLAALNGAPRPALTTSPTTSSPNTTVTNAVPPTTVLPTTTVAPTPTTAAPAPAPPPLVNAAATSSQAVSSAASTPGAVKSLASPPAVIDTTPAVPVIPTAPTGPSLIARTKGGPIYAYNHPPRTPDPAVSDWSFDATTQFGSPTTFLVTAESGIWLQVVLPIRANNTRGWIPRADVNLSQTAIRARVSISQRRVTVWNGNEVLVDTSAVVGKPSTPTPTGLYYVTDVIDSGDPNGVYGPYVLALSARSEVFDFFNGGEPITALHGTSSPWLIGTAASNGCIRLPNSVSTLLAANVPLGASVFIEN